MHTTTHLVRPLSCPSLRGLLWTFLSLSCEFIVGLLIMKEQCITLAGLYKQSRSFSYHPSWSWSCSFVLLFFSLLSLFLRCSFDSLFSHWIMVCFLTRIAKSHTITRPIRKTWTQKNNFEMNDRTSSMLSSLFLTNSTKKSLLLILPYSSTKAIPQQHIKTCLSLARPLWQRQNNKFWKNIVWD